MISRTKISGNDFSDCIRQRRTPGVKYTYIYCIAQESASKIFGKSFLPISQEPFTYKTNDCRKCDTKRQKNFAKSFFQTQFGGAIFRSPKVQIRLFVLF